MPYSVNLKRYTFLINQKTQLIIELFNNACDQYCKKDKDDQLSSDLKISEAQLRKGFISKLLNSLESMSETKYGASFVILNPINYLKLDPKADKILDTFTNELNIIFKQNHLTSHDLNQIDNIESPALVFRILLLRLLTIALSNDNTYHRDGEILLNIYVDFINNALQHVNEFENEKKIFSYFSTKEHLTWMKEIRHVLLAIKLIHSHQDTVTECLTTIKSLTHTIQRMVLAHLYLANKQCDWPLAAKMTGALRIFPMDLDDQFIDSKLNEYEVYLDNKNTHKSIKNVSPITNGIDIMTFAAIEHLGRHQNSKLILDGIDICNNPHIAALIACKNNRCPEKTYQKLEALYALYFKSRCLLISLEQIDELLTTCSWVPLVTGMINLNQICEMIKIHVEGCSNLLAISNIDDINKLSFNQVILQKCFHAQAQLTEMSSKIRALEDLQNPARLEKIKYEITENLNNLIVVQDALNICILQHSANNIRSQVKLVTMSNTSQQYRIANNSSPHLLTDKPDDNKIESKPGFFAPKHQITSSKPELEEKNMTKKQWGFNHP